MTHGLKWLLCGLIIVAVLAPGRGLAAGHQPAARPAVAKPVDKMVDKPVLVIDVAANAEQRPAKPLQVAGGLRKTGSGTLILAAGSRCHGIVKVEAGTLRMEPGSALFDAPSAPADAIEIGNGATLELEHWLSRAELSLGMLPGEAERLMIDGGRLRVTGITGSGRGFTIKSQGVVFEAAAGADWLLHDLREPHDVVFVGTPPLTFTGEGRGRFDKAVSSAGKIVKEGSGSWIIDSLRFETGTVEVRQGVLELTRPVLPDAQEIVVAKGAKLFLRFDGSDAVGALVLDGKRLPGGTYNAKTHPAALAGPGNLVVGGPAVIAPPALTYELAKGWEEWPPNKLNAIRKSMDYAAGLYNAGGRFPQKINVGYNKGVPTAETSFYQKTIRFGGLISPCCALHEMAHAMGSGTHWKWKNFNQTRTWTGPYAVAFVQQMDGPKAKLSVDKIHFWPYGMNFPKESSPVNDRIHVRLVEAIRRDMGIH